MRTLIFLSGRYFQVSTLWRPRSAESDRSVVTSGLWSLGDNQRLSSISITSETLIMSFSDFTKLYGTTAKAKFWCDYMTGLKGQLQVTLAVLLLVSCHNASFWLADDRLWTRPRPPTTPRSGPGSPLTRCSSMTFFMASISRSQVSEDISTVPWIF